MGTINLLKKPLDVHVMAKQTFSVSDLYNKIRKYFKIISENTATGKQYTIYKELSAASLKGIIDQLSLTKLVIYVNIEYYPLIKKFFHTGTIII